MFKALYLITVFHELCKVEQSLRDLSDVLRYKCLLDALNQFILQNLSQLSPTRDERGVKQISTERETSPLSTTFFRYDNSMANDQRLAGKAGQRGGLSVNC